MNSASCIYELCEERWVMAAGWRWLDDSGIFQWITGVLTSGGRSVLRWTSFVVSSHAYYNYRVRLTHNFTSKQSCHRGASTAQRIVEHTAAHNAWRHTDCMRIFYIAVKSVVTECAIFGVERRMRPCEVYVFLCGHAATWMTQGSGCVILKLACRLYTCCLHNTLTCSRKSYVTEWTTSCMSSFTEKQSR